MRYKLPKHGEKRIQSWFAIKPITINNETRWFERVTVEQSFVPAIIDNCNYSYWINLRFID